MQVELRKPDLERFIHEQVKAGFYASPEAAVEAAVAQMMLDGEAPSLTAQDAAAIEASEAEIDRGECVDFDDFAAAMKKKFCGE